MCARWMFRRPTITSPKRARRSKRPTRRTPTIPGCASSSTRNPTNRPSSRSGGGVGTNQLAEAAPNGDTMGFFTIDVIAQLLGNPALRVNYSDFAMIAGVEEPLVAYARKDTPPGLKVATDIMQAKEFKALSLNAQNSNTINQALSLDLLGLKYRPIPAYRGLKEVETAILQNEGQF